MTITDAIVEVGSLRREAQQRVVKFKDKNEVAEHRAEAAVDAYNQALAILQRTAQTEQEALQAAAKLIPVARQYFPKSVRHADRFQLENTCAAIGRALQP